MRKSLALIVICALFFWNWQAKRSFQVKTAIPAEYPGRYTYDHPIDNTPYQNEINPDGKSYPYGEYQFSPLAEFQVRARVLGVKHYSLGRESDLSPVDLALGWGPMAEPAIIDSIQISQGGRFYVWRSENPPLPVREISRHSANMHFIPANVQVTRELMRVESGDTVRFRGYLVEISGMDGWKWRSSLTRNDTGNGACEVVLVDDLTVFKDS